jgi:hypothetical protein
MLEIKIKVPLSLIGKLTSFVAKIALLADQKVDLSKKESKTGKIASYRYNILTGTATIYISEEFVSDYLDLYGNIILSGFMFGKILADAIDTESKLTQKWFLDSNTADVIIPEEEEEPDVTVEDSPIVNKPCICCGNVDVPMTLEEIEKGCIALCPVCKQA